MEKELLKNCKDCGGVPLIHMDGFGTTKEGHYVECRSPKCMKKLGPFSNQPVAVRVWNNEEGKTEEQLTDEQILKTMHLGWDLMFGQARVLAMLPLEDWLKAMNRADSFGPILDPTLWIKGNKKMDVIKEMIEACLVVKNKFLELQTKVGKPDGL